VTFLSTLSAGVTNILIPSPTDGARNPRELMNTIQREKVTLMPAIPKIIERLLKQEGAADKLQSLRILMSGGEKLPMDLYNQTKKLLPNTKLWQGYGSTEVKILTINKDEQNDGALHVGRSISPDIQIDLRTPNDQGIGEIWVQTPGNSQRYLGVSADEAGNTFQPNGWVNMGDLGAQDERTNLKVMGRSKEIIKRAGEILSPDDFDLRLNQVLVQDGAKVIKDAITFSYTPPGTDRESVVSIVLLADGFKQETGQSLNARLQQVVKAGTMTGRYVPDLILPLTQKNFPEGFLSAIGKKQYKNCRAFLNDLIAKGAIKLNGKDVQILKPEQLGG
jgi:acyl-coenzyme A synthetase/AMP-(fatty) acid ligase